MIYTFPLPFRPTESYHVDPRRFGAPREGGARAHAGCDLYVPVGSPVLAVSDGLVITRYPFYEGTWAVVVDHGSFVARYGEIAFRDYPAAHTGAKIKQGQVIGEVGRLTGYEFFMLHYEMYLAGTTEPLTDKNNPPFQRHRNLMDPTAFLDTCKVGV